MARTVGLDVGRRRIGVAISDASATLARPVGAIAVQRLDAQAVEAAARQIERLAAETDPVAAIVVGLPSRLDGSPTDMTPDVRTFSVELGRRTNLPVILQDERLTSREAENRLAVRIKDWRRRKAHLDAAAAAVILQEYLDRRGAQATGTAEGAEGTD